MKTSASSPRRSTLERRRKAARLKRAENQNKQKVRDRDGWLCRFCGSKLHLEVSHREHKGLGGDPTGLRSLPDGMIALCRAHHQGPRFSLDGDHGLIWLPLTRNNADGPIRWLIWDKRAMDLGVPLPPTVDSVHIDYRCRLYIEVAREVYVGGAFVREWDTQADWQKDAVERVFWLARK